MSEHLKVARSTYNKMIRENHPTEQRLELFLQLTSRLLFHLEAQSNQPQPVPPHRHRLAVLAGQPDETYLTSLPVEESAEVPATTVPSTTDERWAAEASTLRAMLESWLSGRATTRSLVDQVFGSVARMGVLPDDEQILALAAAARKLTSPRADSKSSAAISESDAVPSRSGLSEPSTDPSTGLSVVAVDQAAEEWIRGSCNLCNHSRGDHTLRGRCTWTMCSCSINALGFLADLSSHPSDAAPSGEEKYAAEDFANDLCVNLDIEIFTPEGERIQSAVLKTWQEHDLPSEVQP
jgi:hypothetical protein